MTAHVVPRRRTSALHILLNATSGASSRIVMMIVGFSLTPFIISKLGIQQYGLWAVVGSLAGYLGLLDFGLGGAFVKFITEYVEGGDQRIARQVVSFGMLFYAAFGLVLALPVLVLAPTIVHAFKMPVDQYASAAQLLRWMFLILVATMIVNVPGMAVVSVHRMDLASRNGLIGYLAYAVTTFGFLRAGFGISSLVISAAAQTIVSGSLQYITARRHFGPIWASPLQLERTVVRRLFGFSGWTQLTSIFQIMNLDVGRFIAAGLVSVASVGYYEIGSKLAYYTRSFPSYLLDAMMPAATAANAHRDDAKLRRMYAEGTRYQMFVTLAFVGFVVGGIDPMIRVWLGKPYPFVSAVVFWLGIGYAISALNGVGVTIFRAMGLARYEAQYTIVATVANLASTVFLAKAYGIVGVAMATALGWLVGTIYFTFRFQQIRRSSWWPDIGWPSMRLAIATILASYSFALVLHSSVIEPFFKSKIAGCFVLAVISLTYFAFYTALTFLFNVWSRDRAKFVERWKDLKVRVSGARLRSLLHRGA